MPEAKTVFLKEKDLRDWLASVVKHDNWQKCLAYVRSEMMSSSTMTMDMMRGAQVFETVIANLPDPDDSTAGTYPKTGLRHDLEPKPRTKESLKKKE